MSDVLERICADKRCHIEARKVERPLAQLEGLAYSHGPVRNFASALAQASNDGGFGLIAEIKKASPSKGLIRSDMDARTLAGAYQEGGATCLSVLTDLPYFQGRDDDLVAARKAVSLPVLRKDFMLDPYQVTEARALGADCILLIMAALADDDARVMIATAQQWGMDVLVEVHDATELERALTLDTRLIGLNNRNLKTLHVNLATTELLAPRVPEDRILVCESGLSTHSDLERMAAVGARCFLVGESLMRNKDVTQAVRNLLGVGPAQAMAKA